jgi:hypothetical protein
MTKLWNYYRREITYQNILASLLVCLLVLTYLVWPSISHLIHKKQNYLLIAPPDTIPFLMLEKEKDMLLNTIYLAFWDVNFGKLYKDDALPICEVSGQIEKIYWTGNKQIFLSPSNDRGSLKIINQDPTYQIIVKTLINPEQALIKPSFDGRRVYELSVDPEKGKLKLNYTMNNKVFSFETEKIEQFPNFKLIKPIHLVPDDLNPTVYCLFEIRNNPKKGFGVLKGRLEKQKVLWEIWNQVNETISSSNINQFCLFNSKLVFSKKEKLHVDILSNNNEIRVLSSANNYLVMFHNYVFGSSESQGFVRGQANNLIERGIVSPTFNVFNQYLFVSWTPNFTSNENFNVKQVLAIKDGRSSGRIEVIGDKILMFQDSKLISEEIGDKRFLSSSWIFPID